MFESGRLRHRVDVEKQIRQANQANGESRVVWSKVHKNVACRIEYLSGREYLLAQEKNSEMTARITMRYHPGLKASQRIVHKTKRGTELFNILAVLPDRESLQEYVTIPCSAGVSDDGS